MLKLRGLAELAVVVDDLDACEAFYTRLLGSKPFEHKPGRHAFYDVSGFRFLLFIPGCMGSRKAEHCGGPQHFAFRIEPSQVESAQKHLRDLGIDYDGPFDDPGKISIYFSDPAKNRVEYLAPTA
jgi:catechol-2,3-dioxygenase